ncbi:MAG: DUF423 domain-containing protein [Myxococcales bacterium]|nr:DUF423 domain-containing protein [Myxococcales bacterium]
MTPLAARLFALAALLAFLAVAAGAFGAHALAKRLSPELRAVFETAARYQMFHALGLFAVAWLAQCGAPRAGLAATLMVAGTVIFSGSLYLLALTNARWLGAITPLGGVCLLAAWLVVAWSAWRLSC